MFADGRGGAITSTRLVSLTQRGAAAILYEVQALGDGARLVVQSELVANENGQVAPKVSDPRAAAALTAPLKTEEAYHDDLRVSLIHRLERCGNRMCATMDHKVEGPRAPSECRGSGTRAG